MILEQLEIGGNKYYQWTLLNVKDNNSTGDIFSNWREIEEQKKRLILQNKYYKYEKI